MPGVTRPVQGGAYSGPRSEPGGQRTPKAGRSVASYGTYGNVVGQFTQQVDQGDIFDDYSDATAVVTASGSGVEDYQPIYDDAASGTISVSGSGVESYSHITPYDAVIEVDSPVSHWKLGETTIATDRKGVRNLPAVNGPFTTAEGLVAGNDDSLSTVCNRALLQEFKIAGAAGVGIPFDTATYSIEVWFKQTTANTSNLVYRAFSNQRLQMTSSRFPLFSASDGTGAVKSATSPTSIVLGTTTHLVGTYDGTDLILYVNGIEKARTAMTGMQAATTSAPVLGSANAVTYADGTLDEVAWYNTALSPASVLAHYRAGIPSGDFGSGTITASGSGVEDYSHDVSASGRITASGTGTETLVYGDDATINTPGLYDVTIDVDTPVSHWKLGETGQATDRKGVQNLSAVSGPVVATDGLVANNGSDVVASFFDGATPPSVGQRFAVAPAVGVGVPYDTASWSVEAWIKPRFLGLEPDVLARSGGVFIYVDSSGVINWSFSGTSQSVGTARLGVTTHLIATYDGATFRGYVNGQLAFSVSVIPPASTPTRAPVIGAAPESGPRSGTFNGIIDEVSWYNTALTPARILAHYRTGLRFEIGSSGSSTESTVYADSRTATVSVIGTGFETNTPYDAVLDEDNPVSHWKMGDPNTAIDRRQKLNIPATGTIVSTTGLIANNAGDLANRFVGAVYFYPGGANYPTLYLADAWTMECWFNTRVLNNNRIIARASGTGSRIALGANGSLQLTERDATSTSQFATTAAGLIALGQTYHVAATFDGSMIRLYVNGVERASAACIGATTDTSAPQISANSATNDYDIDEVAWYNNALTASRILAHYQAGVATTYDAVIDADTPVSHWKMGWNTTKAVDRARRRLNLDAQNPPIAISDKGVVYQGDNDRANTFAAGSSQRFIHPDSGRAGSDGTLYNTANFSVEAWIKPSATSLVGSRGILRRPNSEVILSLLNTQPRAQIVDPSLSTKAISGPISLTAGAAYHLMSTYDGSNLILYVNGVEVARLASATGISSDLTAYPQIGYHGGSYWDGDIDEVAWYDTALSPSRVRTHFLAGLAGYITVNGTGTDSAVHSGSGTGTISATGTGVEVYVTGVYAQAVLVDNPTGYWRLADLSDSSGNGFTLTKQGTVDDVPSLLAAEPGANQAKQFFTNIGLDALTRPDTPKLHLTNDHTVEAWVTSAFLEATFDGAVQLTEHFRISSSYSGGVTRLRGLHYTTGGFWPLDSTTEIELDTPYHVVLVKEGAAQRLYINGVLESSATLVGNPNPTSNPFCIGAEAGVWNGWWGKVDEVAIYTHALSPSRIQEHYVAGSGGGTSYTDSGSGTVTASGTGVESYSASDSLTGTIIASGVSSESNLGTGSASGTIAVSGTGTETYVYTDSPTGTITVSGSGTETYISVDSRIGTIAVSGTGNETYVYTDAASGTVTVSGTSTESYTTPIIYTDARSGTIIASGTGIDSRVYTDSSTGAVVSTGTRTDNAVYADTSTGTVVSTGTRTDNAVYADTSTGTVVATGTGIESYSALIIYTDASSGTITVSGTGTESGVYTDTVTGTVVSTGTRTDNAVYDDTSTGIVAITGTRTDSDVYDDSTTGTVSATGTGTDVFAHSNTSIGTSLISGTGVESESYTDSAIGTTILSGTSSETSDQSSSSVGTVVVSGTGIDSRVYTDAMSGTLLISGTGVDSSEVLIGYVDASTGQINATGTSVESQSHTSTATGSLLTDGTSVESQSHTSLATGSILASGTRVESRSYTDTATGFVLVDGTGSETNVIELVYTDLSEGVVTSTGTVVESVSYSRTATGTVEVTGISVDSAFYDNTTTGTITLFGSSVVSDSYTDVAFGIIVLTGTGREFYNETQPVQPVPVTTIIALNRINVSVWNQTPIRSVVTSRAPIVVHIALQHNVRVAVTKRNQMKVLVTSL